MRGLLLKFALVFSLCLVVSTVMLAATVPVVPETNPLRIDNSQPQLPDEDSVFLSSILSALGGFGGGGLLLIFLVRRFIQNYDDTQKRWESRFEQISEEYDLSIEKMWEKWEGKYEKMAEKYDNIIDGLSAKWEQRQDKLLGLVENVKTTAGELKYEALRLKDNMVTRDMCTGHSVQFKVLNERFDTLTEKVNELETKVG